MADSMGLVSAIGYYDVKLAKTFLGIENGKYIGGRLENYIAEIPDDKMIRQVENMIYILEERCEIFQKQGKEGYELIAAMEKEYVENIQEKFTEL